MLVCIHFNFLAFWSVAPWILFRYQRTGIFDDILRKLFFVSFDFWEKSEVFLEGIQLLSNWTSISTVFVITLRKKQKKYNGVDWQIFAMYSEFFPVFSGKGIPGPTPKGVLRHNNHFPSIFEVVCSAFKQAVPEVQPYNIAIMLGFLHKTKYYFSNWLLNLTVFSLLCKSLQK